VEAPAKLVIRPVLNAVKGKAKGDKGSPARPVIPLALNAAKGRAEGPEESLFVLPHKKEGFLAP
jgi:hypothetical protein